VVKVDIKKSNFKYLGMDEVFCILPTVINIP
jgi:hypothetical protein